MDEPTECLSTSITCKTPHNDYSSARGHALRACPVFAQLCDEEITLLASHTNTVHYNSGQFLMRRGEPSTHVLLITNGVAQMSVSALNGQEFIIGMVGRNTLLGDCLRELEPQPMDVMAHEPLSALRIARHILQILDPLVLSTGFNLLLNERLQGTLETLQDLALFNLRPRLARLLTRMHNNEEKNPAGRLTRYNQGTLASMVGASRPRVNEHLQYFRQIGAIEIQAGLVLIRQVGLLEQQVLAPERIAPLIRSTSYTNRQQISAP
ncbi:Crp/Fnr family transcriptional regulator [Pseudomonas sp. MWU16-30317]|uniref:Crp/Fnr family transcriptional regulator n=1 Tax=Pseudomonas sp. MWU16-30317 TaxID=2878095 RepID=UPI001CFAC95D|nr:Crp/Fnr family transcriptional regulator [Pseudomonas sp. MWU16-30317]